MTRLPMLVYENKCCKYVLNAKNMKHASVNLITAEIDRPRLTITDHPVGRMSGGDIRTFKVTIRHPTTKLLGTINILPPLSGRDEKSKYFACNYYDQRVWKKREQTKEQTSVFAVLRKHGQGKVEHNVGNVAYYVERHVVLTVAVIV